MDEISKEDQVRKVLEEQLGWSPVKAWPGQAPHFFSLEKANIHDNKTDFVTERDIVTAIVDHLDEILKLLAASSHQRTELQQAMIDRLRPAIDDAALRVAKKDTPKLAVDLAVRNVIQSGFYFGSLLLIANMYETYMARLIELREQERQFWNVANRPPTHYPRTIALRFAKFYAREMGRKPTFGTSSDGPHPSTEFGRVLEKIFDILGFKVKLANPAKWAVQQITDDDLRVNQSDAYKNILELMAPQNEPEQNPHKRIADALMKGSTKKPL